MSCIEEKFKECPPEITVQNIKECLKKVSFELEDTAIDADVGDCYSAVVKPKNKAAIQSNGKGVTPDLARASGYAEFIERLQCGLLLYKYQSILRDKDICLHTYAPDGKYMTTQELIDNGEWMDHVIATYGGGLTRKKLAGQCKMYACTDEDKILTLPFYSLFEDKYVYLPAGYVEHMYTANGCCAGNTRDEAWVHALSEILERYATIKIFANEEPAPIISSEVINQYPIPRRIFDSLKQKGNFAITIYDFSCGTGYPIVGTLLINRDSQDYTLNVSADPILEIAISRGLTEILQGQKIDSYSSRHGDKLLLWDSPISTAHNLINQLETGNGLMSIKFFADSPNSDGACAFEDNRNKTNAELLQYALNLIKDMGRPIYVRNYSFLDFPTYKFVIPGFSETRGMWLTEKLQEYGLGDMAASVFRNPTKATVVDLNFALIYFSKMQDVFSRRDNFPRLSGLPMKGNITRVLLYATVSYASYKLGRYSDAAKYLKNILSVKYSENDPLSLNQRRYLQILHRYLDLKSKGATKEQIWAMLTKFFDESTVDTFSKKLENGENLYDEFLLKCDTKSCANCTYGDACSYNAIKDLIKNAGEYYNKFTDGQSKKHFAI